MSKPDEHPRRGEEAPLTPEQPGRYIAEAVLGRGGMGEVRLTYDRHMDRDVAYKLMTSKAEGSRARLDEARFLDEARITGQLEHPGVIPVHELGRRADGGLYYTMKVVRGRTLAEALDGRDLQERLALLPAFIDCCQAIAYAHSKGFIHRDLKPANVMLGAFGETVVLDWGLAQAVSRAPTPEEDEEEGEILGTPGYMPPEQARGEARLDARADVYALGAILYKLLTGLRPHGEGSSFVILGRVLSGPPAPPQELEPRSPSELCAIAQRALAHDLEARYPNAKALVADLEAFLTGGLVQAYVYSFRDRLKLWIKRHRRLLLLIGLSLMVGVGVWGLRSHVESRRIARAEARRVSRVLGEVDALLSKAALGGEGPGWFDAAAIRLISMSEPAVAARVARATRAEAPMLRRLAIQALSGMPPEAALEPLIERLEPAREPDFDLRVLAARSLGILGDHRAEAPLHAAREASRRHSPFWKATQTAYRMLPLPPIEAEMGLEAWLERGRRLQNKQRWREADAAYSEGLALAPRDVRLLTNRSTTRKALGDLEGAIADLDLAIKIDPAHTMPRHNRGLLLRRVGRLEGSLADFEIAIDSPHRAVSLRSRAWTWAAMGRMDAARADIHAAMALKPGVSSNHYMLGELAHGEGRMEEAELRYTQALQLNPESPATLAGLAEAQIHRGAREEATRSINRLMVLAPEDVDSHSLNLERLRWELGAEGEAYTQALKLAQEQVQPRELAWALEAVQGALQRGDAQTRAAAMERLLEHGTPLYIDGWRLLALTIARVDGAEVGVALEAPTGSDPYLAGLLRLATGAAPQPERNAYLVWERCALDLARLLDARRRGDDVTVGRILEVGVWRRGVSRLSCATLRWAQAQMVK